MNYFTHALNYLDRPYFMAGTAVPDWLSVADRKVRLRPNMLQPWLVAEATIQCEVASGALQHLNDDDWFHSTRGFVEITNELTGWFRSFLGPDERYHCGFLGHVGMELILDGVLMEMYPQQFQDYWKTLDDVEPSHVETAVNRMARFPTERLAWFIDLYRREQFLRSYESDDALIYRLSQVSTRVKLPPIPCEAAEVVTKGRSLVRRRLRDLLPEEHYSLP
jgi:hypothetical protein